MYLEKGRDTYEFGIQLIKSLHYQAVHLLWGKQKILEWTDP